MCGALRLPLNQTIVDILGPWGPSDKKEVNMGIRDHRKLDVFGYADDVVLQVYRATDAFPASEQFGLVSQMRRAAVSVVANIVEGCGRKSNREFDRFLDIPIASARELAYLIELAGRLGFLPGGSIAELEELHDRSASALGAFINSRKRSHQ